MDEREMIRLKNRWNRIQRDKKCRRRMAKVLAFVCIAMLAAAIVAAALGKARPGIPGLVPSPKQQPGADSLLSPRSPRPGTPN